jgi:hypothetical protein
LLAAETNSLSSVVVFYQFFHSHTHHTIIHLHLHTRNITMGSTISEKRRAAMAGAIKAAHHDIYSYSPFYEWTSYKTCFGMFLSWISIFFIVFYVALTMRDYIMRPPELVSQGDIDLLTTPEEYRFAIPKIGLRLEYDNSSEPEIEQQTVGLSNENPYVELHFRHVVMRDQVRVKETELESQDCEVALIPSICPVVGPEQKLQGVMQTSEFEFLEISVDKCTSSNGSNKTCAPLRVIDSSLESGEFRVRTSLSIAAQQFDVERFHATGNGAVPSNRSMIFYSLPGLEVQGDIIFKARKIQKEQRYIGSPPLPETEARVLSFSRREITYMPRPASGANLLTFVVRIDDNVRLEEVAYWCPSILDLFGLWGAMASFIASLSIGFLANTYNRWRFHRHFYHMANVKRQEARRMIEATMEWMRKKDNNRDTSSDGSSGNCFAKSSTRQDRIRRREIYKNLQEQYDMCMVEPDLRLFESHHFDKQGHVNMSAAELKFPSTAFGELRRLAIVEHGKKKRAARFLSLWYGRLLVKRGFIKDPQRRRELFSPISSTPVARASIPFNFDEKVGLVKRMKSVFDMQSPSPLRRRKNRKRGEESNSTSSQDQHSMESPWISPDIETGEMNAKKGSCTAHEQTNNSPTSLSVGVHERSTRQVDMSGALRCAKEVNVQQQQALRVIAQLDPMTKTW